MPDHARAAPLAPPAVDWVRAYIGLGANVGDAEQTLVAAVHALAAIPGTALAGVSRLYASAPVGVTDQPAFLNAVAAIDVPSPNDPAMGAADLLTSLKAIERAFGRRRRRRWGPRELDLDLLTFGDARIRIDEAPVPSPSRAAATATPPEDDVPFLQLPHAAAHERLFVLAPLEELAPDLIPPGWSETVRSAAARARSGAAPNAAVPLAAWGDETGTWRRRRRRRTRAVRPATSDPEPLVDT